MCADKLTTYSIQHDHTNSKKKVNAAFLPTLGTVRRAGQARSERQQRHNFSSHFPPPEAANDAAALAVALLACILCSLFRFLTRSSKHPSRVV
mmetsp:Transcript_17313/g.56635  ORF Transcript_17313/g.56635 Transcript_17313/m.56635 type:complete len:93 (+) Transcript_17313:57-335(+)